MSNSTNAHSGNAYSGIVTYWNDDAYPGPQWREYIQTAIVLTNGFKYDVSFWVCLAPFSSHYTQNIGAHISSSPPSSGTTSSDQYAILITPTFQNANNINFPNQWQKLSFTFNCTSSGTYYLTIGDFSQNNSPVLVNNSSPNWGFGYYFIDDVAVKKSPGCCPADLVIQNTTYSSGQSYTVSASNSITTGPNVTVNSGSTVFYTAGNYINLNTGFVVQASSNFTASIEPCPSDYQLANIPILYNVITPNGDGHNDQLCLYPSGANSYSIQVFNRWGNVVYSASNVPITTFPVCVWNGSGVVDGTYFIIFTLHRCDFPDQSYNWDLSVFNGSSQRLKAPEDTTLSNNYFEQDGIQLYPNPTHNSINLNCSFVDKPYEICIINSAGVLVMKLNNLTLDDTNLDFNSFSRGVYIFKLQSQSGLFVKKIIIE